MSILLHEQRIRLTSLAKQEEVSVTTVWRWAQRGVKGFRLETFTIGGRRFTTQEAFERFVDRTTRTAQVHPTSPSKRTARQARTRQLSAEQALLRDGV